MTVVLYMSTKRPSSGDIRRLPRTNQAAIESIASLVATWYVRRANFLTTSKREPLRVTRKTPQPTTHA